MPSSARNTRRPPTSSLFPYTTLFRSFELAIPVEVSRLYVGNASNAIENGYRLERSEEHTSELQSRLHIVCRLLLETRDDHRLPHSFPTRRSSDLSSWPSPLKSAACTSATRPTPSRMVTGSKDRKSTRLNSSHGYISYAVFC